MCVRTINYYWCGHTSDFTKVCERTFDNCPFSITPTKCANPTLVEKTVRDVCPAMACKYEQQDKRWICHVCDMDNENSMTCEGQGCDHSFCGGCCPWESSLANIPHRTPEEMKRAELRAMGRDPDTQFQSTLQSPLSVPSQSSAETLSTVQTLSTQLTAPSQLTEPTQQAEPAERPENIKPPKSRCEGCSICIVPDAPSRPRQPKSKAPQPRPSKVPVYDSGAGDWVRRPDKRGRISLKREDTSTMGVGGRQSKLLAMVEELNGQN
ncbi:hypothetical protein JMJ77_0013736 [Colletotrichum scovillei]|uniref:Uncharacterized protein n=1 Tax=Colletotrichum scovillei TaxID=1209932 RepID=A0A9P7R4H8_9PEZI|nr:hypothetical protein JMJ77_0013736 [Colletotrichum scovillei]KAG7065255.1 hypothetical protein JMJ78_0012011 [Colletotrichum scovillei]KAG7067857.1 hypothetical protein JMJ76_0007556 [Colletotrichum scovillei]